MLVDIDVVRGSSIKYLMRAGAGVVVLNFEPEEFTDACRWLNEFLCFLSAFAHQTVQTDIHILLLFHSFLIFVSQ